MWLRCESYSAQSLQERCKAQVHALYGQGGEDPLAGQDETHSQQ